MRSVQTRPVKHKIADVEAIPYEIDPERVLEPTVLKASTLFRRGDNSQCYGVWEVSPGKVGGFHGDEMFYVLEGRATVEFDGGQTLEIGTGDMVVIPDGIQHTWTIHERVRKVFVLNGERQGSPDGTVVDS